jgi:hypothetical protein
MEMDQVFGAISNVVPSASILGGVADVAASLAPPPGAGTAKTAMVVSPAEPLTDKLKKYAVPAAGIVGGALLWKKHRVLGAVAGHAVAYAWAHRDDKKRVMCDLVVEGAGIAGALYHKKIPGAKKSPVVGFVMGVAAGLVGTYFVDGSPAKEQFQWLKQRLGK